MRIVFFILLLLFGAFAMPAAETCPWFNAATAGGVLESPVDLLVTHPGSEPGSKKDDATCDFTRTGGSGSRELRIEVRTTLESNRTLAPYLAKCQSKPVALRAIGNEAMACSVAGENGQSAEQVAGRVRDRIFLITVRSGDKWVDQSVLREKVRSVAEQIAGNLF